MKAFSSLREIKNQISAGQTSCRDLVIYYLQNIESNRHLGAFLEVYAQEALQRAEQIDQKIQAGSAGRLAGAIIGIKDVFCYADHPLQCASQILDGFRSQFTATAIQRLLEEDAIIIGRQNCDEFAMGSSCENSSFGPVRNALNPELVPGGSSGGSAVAVQADMCLISIGSDTGGSVRQPAAFCGISGLKPSYSRISRYGLAAYASSFDCVGILAKNIEDIALCLEIMAGADEYDSTVSSTEVPRYSQMLDFDRKSKIVYIEETVNSDKLQPEVKELFFEQLDWLRTQGHEIKSIHIPLLNYILPVYYILTTAEASSNLARYDGVRYGFRAKQNTRANKSVNQLIEMYKKSRSEGFGAEVKRRILLGTFVLSADYYDAYYTKAQKIRRLLKDETDKILNDNDFIVMPTTPTTAFKIGAHAQDPVQMYLEDLYTVQANVVGIPAISVPIGKDKTGMPIGFQIMTGIFKEAELLAFSNYLLENK